MKGKIRYRNSIRVVSFSFILLVVSLSSFSGGFAESTLRLLSWPSYTHPRLIQEFEEVTGIQVVVEIFESNEGLAEVLRRGSPAYDVVVPSDSWVALLSEEGLLCPFDATTLEGFDNIGDQWLSPYFDPGLLYSVPFLWGTLSFMVNTDILPDPERSLRTLFEPPERMAGKVGMMTDSRDVIDLALLYLNLPSCTQEPEHLQSLQSLLIGQSDFVRGYSMVADVVDQIVAGEIAIQMIYNGAAMRARLKSSSIKYIYPREGVTVWSDNLAIPANAPNVKAARKFLEFFLRPENIAAQSNLTLYGNMIKGSTAFLDSRVKNAPELIISPDIPVRYVQVCEQDVLENYRSIWNSVLSRPN